MARFQYGTVLLKPSFYFLKYILLLFGIDVFHINSRVRWILGHGTFLMVCIYLLKRNKVNKWLSNKKQTSSPVGRCLPCHLLYCAAYNSIAVEWLERWMDTDRSPTNLPHSTPLRFLEDGEVDRDTRTRASTNFPAGRSETYTHTPTHPRSHMGSRVRTFSKVRSWRVNCSSVIVSYLWSGQRFTAALCHCIFYSKNLSRMQPRFWLTYQFESMAFERKMSCWTIVPPFFLWLNTKDLISSD